MIDTLIMCLPFSHLAHLSTALQLMYTLNSPAYTFFLTPMQRPTLDNARIRSTRDALYVFNGVARKVLPLITRRLDVDERRAIIAGHIYVWEERGPNTENIGMGMERWTDGMAWGPSRVRDGFLFYHQKDADEDPSSTPQPWTLLTRKRDGSRHSHREPEKLIKQTYSVHVSLPSDASRGIVRKWHITAYFSQEALESLRSMDSIPGVGDVPIPDNVFVGARNNKARRDTRHSQVTTQIEPDPSHMSYRGGRCGTHLHATPIGLREHSFSESTSSSSSSSPIHSTSRPLDHSLVPLDVLERPAHYRRDPLDEEVLRRLTKSTNISHSGGYTNALPSYRG